MTQFRTWLALVALVSAPLAAHDTLPIASMPGVDAPELAALGTSGVGFRSITLIHRGQPQLETDAAADVRTDRPLRVDLWYPAQIKPRAPRVHYAAAFWGEPPRAPVTFSAKGIAVANARATGTGLPLVIVSHGYSNAPAAMSWLCENLASKGYIVAAVDHRDPNPYVISPAARAAPYYNRPHDLAFVAQQLRLQLGTQIDPTRVALIGYSMGGYGVLTAGGATLDPASPAMAWVAHDQLKPFARGAARAGEIAIPDIKAIVALAPAGGAPHSSWGAEGLAALRAPLLLIQGDSDPVVDYRSGAAAVFAGAVNTDRYFLTYRQAGHAIALNPAPAAMRATLWDSDWFEDPIWRQDRINAINLHFITAFLGKTLRGEADKSAYLDVATVNSDDGDWAAPAGTGWSAYSPGGADVTLWKGFQRRHARGMDMRHASPVTR